MIGLLEMSHEVGESRRLWMQNVLVDGQPVATGVLIATLAATGRQVGTLGEDEQLGTSAQRHQVVEGTREPAAVLLPAACYVQEAVHLHYPACAARIYTSQRVVVTMLARVYKVDLEMLCKVQVQQRRTDSFLGLWGNFGIDVLVVSSY